MNRLSNQNEQSVIKVNLISLILTFLILAPVLYLGVNGKLAREKDSAAAPVTRSFGIGELTYIANLSPTSDNYFRLAFAYQQKKLFKESIGAYKKAIELDPKNAVAYNNMGFAYGQLGKWEELIAACKKALELDPNFELARNNLAWGEKELTTPQK